MGEHCRRSMKEYRMLEVVYVTMTLQDQANILHRIRGKWTMRSKIVNALLLGEAAIFDGFLGGPTEHVGLILKYTNTQNLEFVLR